MLRQLFVKKERTALFHSEFQKTPDDSKSKALDLFIKKIKNNEL